MEEFLSQLHRGEALTPMQARQHNPLALAYVGDTVYDLYVRTHLLKTQAVNSHRLHVLAIGYVSAHAQAAAFRRMETLLNEDELYIYRRGRNTKPTTVPRNADVQEYRCATGLEAVVGYLFLSGQYERLSQLMEHVLAPQEKTI